MSTVAECARNIALVNVSEIYEFAPVIQSGTL